MENRVAQLRARIVQAEKDTALYRDAVLSTDHKSRELGYARWHYSHARERENTWKEAWLLLTGEVFSA